MGNLYNYSKASLGKSSLLLNYKNSDTHAIKNSSLSHFSHMNELKTLNFFNNVSQIDKYWSYVNKAYFVRGLIKTF